MQLEGASELEKRVYQACLLNEKNPASEDQTFIAMALSDAGSEVQRLRLELARLMDETPKPKAIITGKGCKAVDGLYFSRLENGDVCVTVERAFLTHSVIDDDSHFDIPSNIWASIVLDMTVFSERPNDWDEFMAHHHGRADLFDAAKILRTVRNVVREEK